MANKPEKKQERPKDAREEAVKNIHDELMKLRSTIESEDKNKTKDVDEKKTDEKKAEEAVEGTTDAAGKETKVETAQETHLKAIRFLLRQMKAAEGKQEGWDTLMTSLSDEEKAISIQELMAALDDDKKEGDIRLELSELDDEINATKTYLDQFKPVPPEQKIWDKVTKLSESPQFKKILDKLGMTSESLRDFILNFIINLLENFPINRFQEMAGNLRFKIALEAARKDETLTPEQRAKLDNPLELEKIRKDWNKLYFDWVKRKRATSKGTAFTEDAPTIADVFNPKTPVEAPKETPDLFGVKGLKEKGSLEVSDQIEVTYNGRKIFLSKNGIKIDGTKHQYILAQGSKKGALTVTKATLSAPSQKPEELSMDYICTEVLGPQNFKIADIVTAIDKNNSGEETEISFEKNTDVVLQRK